jgi:hypothetical protein
MLSFAVTLWLLKFLVKQLQARYLLTALVNAFLPPISVGVRFLGLTNLGIYILVGLPILALMYRKARTESLKRPA